MAQLALSYSLDDLTDCQAWFNISKKDFERDQSITHDSTNLFEVLIWGDIAQKKQDEQILNDLKCAEYKCYTGRSWLLINKETQIIHACVDEFGAFPILFYQHNKQTIIASSRTALLEQLTSAPEISKEAMKQLLLYGQLFESDCIFKYTYHFSGQTLIKVDAVNRSMSHSSIAASYIRFVISKSNYSDCKEALIEAVRQSITSSNAPLISLSGGLDSRAILSVCKLLNLKPEALCYGNPHSVDVEYAKLLAKKSDIKLIYSGEKANLNNPATLKKIALASSGEVPVHHAHALVDDYILQNTKGRTVITGTGAETYRAFYYDRGMPGFSFFGYKCLNNISLPRVKRYIKEEFIKLTGPLFNIMNTGGIDSSEFVEQQVNLLTNQNLDAAKVADQFYLKARCQRMVIAGQQLLDSYYNRSHPFLNGDLVSSLANMPASLKIHSTFHRKFICDVAPELAKLPWDKTLKPLSNGLPLSQKYPGLFAKLHLQPAYGKASTAMYSYDFKDYGDALLNNTLSMILIDPKEVKECIQVIKLNGLYNYVMGFAIVWQHMKNKSTLSKVG